ncbi:MAG: dehydrogenase [Ilumatobacteraceae bacterium]|nr:dehydrogenase [Ilumatobacteraceae bacterium]
MILTDLAGRVAVVTGAGGGIGRGYALALAGAGADVVIVDVNDDGGTRVVDEVTALGRQALFVHADVSSAPSTQALGAAVESGFGGVDIVVNNAAIFAGLPSQGLEEMDEALWDKVMGVNVKGLWLVTRAMLPLMRMRGGGVVVNQASTSVYMNSPRRMHYNVSKAAVISMTKTLARELAVDNVRVNAIAPGPTATEALKDVPAEALDRAVQGQAIKRLGTTDDMAGALLFLVGDTSSWITGQVMVVDGGGVMLG